MDALIAIVSTKICAKNFCFPPLRLPLLLTKMLREPRQARLVMAGVDVEVLLALNDTGRPSYDVTRSAQVAAPDIPVFACTPDQFPDLMATALRRADVHDWAADRDIKLIWSDG